MTVRAKFFINKIELFSHPSNTGTVHLGAVYASKQGVEGNACEENAIFGKYTPSGSIMMNIQNPDAFAVFKAAFDANKTFYVDFSEVPE